MTNKELGTLFEREVCEILTQKGFWVHFLSPNRSGAQPFDIIALHNSLLPSGEIIAADCKTCSEPWLRLGRLEINQQFAFERWEKCGNPEPVIFAKYKDKIYKVGYQELLWKGKVRLDARNRWE